MAARSISWKTSGFAMVGGPSSKIFWKRRWVEQSRPFSARVLPYSSPKIWISKWRAFETIRIKKMGEPGTSVLTFVKATFSSSMFVAFRMPLPPPPSEAFTMIGNPTFSARSTASSTVRTIALLKTSSGTVPSSVRVQVRPSPLHGMLGTLAVCARMLAAILSPRAAITPEGGPIKVMPISLSLAGSFGFSLAWPQPGQTASTCCSCAILQIRSTFA
mmetsp:Transcript_32470/g.75831  ORF Transcript_32470/g.75831 Transcript_32470/m.75831 type:complete len:217 (-) Transcript_32470:321-971(-)